MGKMWTKEKIDVLKMYLETGAGYREIARKLELTYDQVEHAVRRYDLRARVDNTLVLPKDKGKLKKDDITKLARLIGQNIYENYRTLKLREPKVLKSVAKREEHSILDISDIHLGMINEVFDSRTGKKEVTYNMNIFESLRSGLP